MCESDLRTPPSRSVTKKSFVTCLILHAGDRETPNPQGRGKGQWEKKK